MDRSQDHARTLGVALDFVARAFAIIMALGIGGQMINDLKTGRRAYDNGYLLIAAWLACILFTAWPRKAIAKAEGR